MTYAVVTAALDLDASPQGVIAASVALSSIFGASVLGIAAGECSLSPYYAEGPVADRFVETSRAELRMQLKLLEQQFCDAFANQDRVAFRSAERLPDHVVHSTLRGSDIVVIARPAGSVNLMRSPDIGNLLMAAGRPVLVVPFAAERFSFGRVVIAWKDTRECRRAVRDALPFLKRADGAHVLCVHEPGHDDRTGLAGADDVVHWLSQHRVKAVAVANPDHGGVGKAVEQFADEANADLIVAGAYGHSRLAEWLMGGVTRHLLRAGHHSVLFSH